MTVIFTEGFDCYGTGTGVLDGLFWKWGVTPTSGVSGVSGFSQGNAISMNGIGAFDNELIAPRFANSQTLICGFWFKRGTGVTGDFAKIYDSTVLHSALRITPAGEIQAYKKDLNVSNIEVEVVYGTGLTTIVAGTWYFVEWKLYVHSTAGIVHVKLNNVDEILLTNQDTMYGFSSGNLYVNEFSLIGRTGGNVFDHLYVVNSTGSPNNTFLGSVQIQSVKPTANGYYSETTPIGAGDNYSAVNDTTPDGDTSYNKALSSDKDTFVLADTTLNGTIISVTRNVLSRKDEAGSAVQRTITRINGTNHYGVVRPVYETYQYNMEIAETNPSTSVTWSKSSVDGAEFGYERVDIGGGIVAAGEAVLGG
jgi:hypothetical protein